MIPILNRGLKQRQTNAKKKAAVIVGSMCSMIADPIAVKPYVKDMQIIW